MTVATSKLPSNIYQISTKNSTQQLLPNFYVKRYGVPYSVENEDLVETKS